MKAIVSKENMSFLDTFYGLASPNGLERATAATALIQHIVVSSDNNKEDGKYALQRLCKGLCSGRASARQGYASCLSTLVKLSSSSESTVWGCAPEKNVLVWLREQLLHFTSPGGNNSQTPKRGSEDRDYRFGRLFGILAMIRSGTLSSPDAPTELVSDYMKDLIALYEYKPWMREPAVKAMMDLISSCHDDSKNVVIPEVIVPFLSKDDPNKLSAEQLALLWYVQAKENSSPELSPSSLSSNKKTLLTPQTFSSSSPELLITLRDTSTVVHPRCHIVWKALWDNLKSTKEDTKSIINALIENFLFPHLLCETMTTHERRALALVLIWQIFTTFQYDDIGQLLQPRIVERAFLHTTNNNKHKKSLLQPLAKFVLRKLVEHATQKKNKDSELRWNLIRDLQHGITQAKSNKILNFDIATQTTTMQTLLGLQYKQTHHDNDQDFSQMWERYVKFLQTEMESAISSKDEHTARSYVDILYNFAKRVFHHNTSTKDDSSANATTTAIIQTIASLFLVQGCMDMTTIHDSQDANVTKSSKKKKKSRKKEILHLVVRTATSLKDQKSSYLVVPYSVRRTMLCRLHSLLSDCKMEMVDFVCQGWQALEQSCGAKAWSQNDDDDDDDKSIKDVIYSASSISLPSVTQLIKALYLNLLSPGRDEDNQGKMEEEEEEDDVKEDVNEVIRDLADIINASHKDDDDENHLDSLAQICIHILSSHFCNNTNYREGSCKLVRDCVKTAWIETIAELPNKENVDSQVMGVLLEAACGEQTMDETMQGDEDNREDSDDEDEDEDDMQDEQTESVFASAVNLNLDDDDENMEEKIEEKIEEEKEINDGDINDTDGDDVELDPSTLESMLLEDSDVEFDGEGGILGELEHHAGADKALAQLIKMKQESRKAGADDREKSEISTRLRCMVLLESVFTSKNKSVLSNQVVLMATLPLLRARRILDKSIQSSKDSIQSSQVGLGEKRALLDRINSLLRSKVLKVKLPGSADIEGCTTLANKIMEEIQKSPNTTHTSLCSLALVLVIKAVDSEHVLTLAKDIYVPALDEWSSKKRTKLSGVIFDDLLSKCPSIARITMTKSLSTAANESRSPYLKSESFRILSDVYSLKQTGGDTADSSSNNLLDNASFDALNDEALSVLKVIELALQDNDLIKGKRVRDVLKACETIASFISDSKTNREVRLSLGILSTPLNLLTESSASINVKNVCTKLNTKILEIVKTQNETDAEMAEKELTAKNEAESKATPSKSSSSKKISTSTKKKKKKKAKK